MSASSVSCFVRPRSWRASGADERDRLADERERIAGEREQIADEREQRADEREGTAIERERDRLQREADREERSAARDRLASAEEARNRAEIRREMSATERREGGVIVAGGRRRKWSNSGSTPSVRVAARPCLSDGDCRAGQTVGPAGYGHSGGLRVGVARLRAGRGPRARGPGSRADLPLVPRRFVGPGLGQGLRLGLEPVPRLARSCGSEFPRGCGALGSPAGLGATGAPSTTVGTWGSADVEPDRRRQLGVLEQRDMDSGLAERDLP